MENERILKVLEIIDYQLATLKAIENPSSHNVRPWRDRTIRFLSAFIIRQELNILATLSTPSWSGDKALYENYLLKLREDIQKLPEMYLIPNNVSTTNDKESFVEKANISSQKVFVVHGHDNLAKLDVARTIEKLGFEAIVLHEQPNEGRTIIEKFEQNASVAGFAIIILTPDDVAYPKDKPDETSFRARQNVILELGYFTGSIGRKRVCVLYKGKVEIPSDYLGVVYTELDNAGAWRFFLAKEMKQAGFNIDLNSL